MKLILQAIKSLFRKMFTQVETAQATAETAQDTAETAQATADRFVFVTVDSNTNLATMSYTEILKCVNVGKVVYFIPGNGTIDGTSAYMYCGYDIEAQRAYFSLVNGAINRMYYAYVDESKTWDLYNRTIKTG